MVATVVGCGQLLPVVVEGQMQESRKRPPLLGVLVIGSIGILLVVFLSLHTPMPPPSNGSQNVGSVPKDDSSRISDAREMMNIHNYSRAMNDVSGIPEDSALHPQALEIRRQAEIDILSEARQMMKIRAYSAAVNEVSSIPKTSPRSREAAKIKLQAELKMARQEREEAAGEAANKRARYAEALEKTALKSWVDADVRATGKSRKVLVYKLRHIAMTRPFVHNIGQPIADTARDLGFTKVLFTDDYHDTWTFDLTNKVLGTGGTK